MEEMKKFKVVDRRQEFKMSRTELQMFRTEPNLPRLTFQDGSSGGSSIGSSPSDGALLRRRMGSTLPETTSPMSSPPTSPLWSRRNKKGFISIDMHQIPDYASVNPDEASPPLRIRLASKGSAKNKADEREKAQAELLAIIMKQEAEVEKVKDDGGNDASLA